MRQTLLLLVLAFVTLAAAAQGQTQPIYRSEMPDGRIIFGDKPAPGAKSSKQVILQAPNIAVPGPTSAPARDGSKPSNVEGGSSKPSNLDTADAEVKSAQQSLDDAKAALEAGREPTENERIGVARGGTRLNEAYDQRIRSLENAVTAAQKRLDDALAKRNAAR